MVRHLIHNLFEPRCTADRRAIADIEEVRGPEGFRTGSIESKRRSSSKRSLDILKPSHALKSYKTMLLSRRAEQREASLPAFKASATTSGQAYGIIPTNISYIPMVKESLSQRHRRSCGRRRAPKNRFALSQGVGRRREEAEGMCSITTSLVEEERVPILEDQEIGAMLSVERDFEERSRMLGQGVDRCSGQKAEVLDMKQTKFKQDEEIATRVMMSVDSSRLSELKAEFTKQDDGLSLQEFVKVMSSFQGKSKNYAKELNRVSELVELFDQVDINCDGTMEWDEFSSFIIDASTDRDGFRVDNIKEYKPTPVRSIPRHNLACFKRSIEHVAYLKELDKIIVSEESAPAALVMDGTTYEKVGQLNGHAGMVHQACHLQGRGVGSYVVTCANDSTIGFFEPERYSLCQRIPTAEVQMSVEYTGIDVDKVYTGGVDGTVNVWHPESLVNLSRTCSHKDIVMDLHCATTMDIMASASLDGKIGLWDLHTGVSRRWLTGHRKGVFSLSHSKDYRFIVSAGFEHEPVVWNPYVRNIVCRMSGHTASLVGVYVVPDSPQIVSADTLGVVKVWDVRNFSCVQTLSLNQSASLHGHGSINHVAAAAAVHKSDLTALGYDGNHKRIILGNYRLHLFDYEQQLDPFITDKLVTIQTLFIPNSLTLITATEASIKLWDAEGGRIIKVYRNLSSSQITAAALEPRRRKFVIGDHHGKISVYNVANGNFIQNFSFHASEIIHLGYLEQANAFLSISLDGVTRLHHMEGETESDDPAILVQFNHQATVHKFIAALEKNAAASATTRSQAIVLQKKRQWESLLQRKPRSSERCFNVCAAAESDKFGMIATAATDFTICLYSAQSSIVEGVFFEHKADIVSLLFLEPFPVLLSADADGMLCLWSLKTTGMERQLIHCLNVNQAGLVEEVDLVKEKPSVTCVSWNHAEERLYIGDDAGHVSVFHSSGLGSIGKKKTNGKQERDLRIKSRRRGSITISANLINLHTTKRPPLLPEESSTFVTQPTSSPPSTRSHRRQRWLKTTNTSLCKGRVKVVKLFQWEAHEECIRSISIFGTLNTLATSSYDKMCKFWSSNGELAGTLYQGSDEKKFADKEWIVNVDRQQQNEQAATRAKEVLASIFSMSQELDKPRQRRRSSVSGFMPTSARKQSIFLGLNQATPLPPNAAHDSSRRSLNVERKLVIPEIESGESVAAVTHNTSV